jgi:Fe-S-cluster-containing hydrogenase component 2/CRP-like cAMP-binding protein
MAKKAINPPSDIGASPSDLPLGADTALKLSLFTGLKNKPTLEAFPGSFRCRHYQKGDVICRQAEAGWTAFYILTMEDAITLLQSIDPKDWRRKEPLDEKIQRLQAAVPHLPPLDRPHLLRRAATVHLSFARAPRETAPGLLDRLFRRSKRSSEVDSPDHPRTIMIDATATIDFLSRKGGLHEGELFGELSCLYGTPRSGTIIADRECYMLEVLSNILNHCLKDPAYRARVDKVYRERMLREQLARFSLFSDLTDRDYAAIRDQLELVNFRPGQIIFDEHERPDAMYIVRNGLVKVLRKGSALLGMDRVRNWSGLVEALRAGENEPATPRGRVWQQLAAPAKSAIAAIGDPQTISDEAKLEILCGLNDLIRDPKFADAPEFKSIKGSQALGEKALRLPEKQADWSEQDRRRYNRFVLDSIYLGLIREFHIRVGPDQILRYCSQGDFFGETSLITSNLRTATCIAQGHTDERVKATDPGRIELVRITKAVLDALMELSPAIKAKVEAQTAAFQDRPAVPTPEDEPDPFVRSAEFDRLGLIQGQRLMLIDLDRCTRCDECVQACVNTHTDGNSRLFLQGERFGKYMVPATCRSCMDPKCMVGCPVGSIHRGGNGEMKIEEWCIGCGLCSRNCPYEAIQMHDIGIIAEDAPGWRYLPNYAVHDPLWFHPRYRDEHWLTGRGPFHYDPIFQESLKIDLPGQSEHQRGGAFGAPSAVFFRYEFQLSSKLVADSQFTMELTSSDPAAGAWINAEPLTPDSTGKGGKREYALPIKKADSKSPAALGNESTPAVRKLASTFPLRGGRNVLAVQVAIGQGESLLQVRMDEILKPEGAEGEEALQKMVTNRAVVCDLCVTIPGKVPACVNACPHEAALRVNAQDFFSPPREGKQASRQTRK